MLDLVESAVAVIGVHPIVSRTVERFTKGKWNEMDALPRRISEAARSVCNGTMSTKIPLGSVNYNSILRDLSEPFDETQITEMVSKFPPELHEMTSGFIIKAQEICASLREILPISKHTTLSGSRTIPVPEMMLRRFVCTLTVLDDPMRAFPLIAAGAILATQVISVRKVYPSIAKLMDESFRAAIESEKSRKVSFELPPRAEIGLSQWLGKPQVDRKFHQALQAALVTPDKKESPAPPDGRTSVIAKEALSQDQAATFPHAMQKAG
jgi:hypothetical protein